MTFSCEISYRSRTKPENPRDPRLRVMPFSHSKKKLFICCSELPVTSNTTLKFNDLKRKYVKELFTGSRENRESIALFRLSSDLWIHCKFDCYPKRQIIFRILFLGCCLHYQTLDSNKKTLQENPKKNKVS